MSVFIKNNKFCIIEKNNVSELDELYNFRGNFVVSQNVNSDKIFKHIVKLSNYAVNIEFLQCLYYDEINKEYQELKKNLYVKNT